MKASRPEVMADPRANPGTAFYCVVCSIIMSSEFAPLRTLKASTFRGTFAFRKVSSDGIVSLRVPGRVELERLGTEEPTLHAAPVMAKDQ